MIRVNRIVGYDKHGAMIEIVHLPTDREPTVKVVDLFCGAGGLAFGLKTAGLNVAAGVDLDPACKWALEENTGAEFVCRDVSKVTAEDLALWYGDADVRVLAG